MQAITSKLDCGQLKWRPRALAREAAVAFGVFVLLLSALTGSFSHSYFDEDSAYAPLPDGGEMCSGGRMVVAGPDGNILPGGNQSAHRDRGCDFCLSMKAKAVLSSPAAALAPLELTAIQTLSPGLAAPMDAAPLSARRNRDPPFQA